MKVIAVVGDSHTWGQGVGAEFFFQPPCVCADKRQISFCQPSYVNLIRMAVNMKTGSAVSEYEGDTIKGLYQKEETSGCRSLSLTDSFALCRIFFHASEEECTVKVSVDGKTVQDRILPAREQDMCSCLINDTLPLLEEGVHNLRITFGKGATADVYRIECYRGPYAVVNCAVGGRPVNVYRKEFFGDYVATLDPYAVLFEGCTINDWLTQETTAEYADEMKKLIAEFRTFTDRILFHTVSPIEDSQYARTDCQYSDYVEAMRQVAKEEKIPLVDCNQRMQMLLDALPESLRHTYLFCDKWHPNTTGHYLYAEMILPELMKLLA